MIRKLCIIFIANLISSLHAAPAEPTAAKLTHPYLIYQPEDRAKLLAHVQGQWESREKGKDPIADHVRGWHGAAFENHLVDYPWEEWRSRDMLTLALATWLTPEMKRPTRLYKAARNGKPGGFFAPPPPMDTFIGCVGEGVKQINVPTKRVRDFFPDESGKPGPWGRYLEASETLWRYAICYDLLSAPEVAKAGRDRKVLDDFYARIADGIFRLLVAHLRTYKVDQPQWGNNWTGRELAGVGMAALAFRDRLEQEPANSQRRKDYEDGLRLVREFSRAYLGGWNYNTNDADFAYWYEGPHYLRYWAESYVPFAAAHERMFPKETPKEMSLEANQPLARFLRRLFLPKRPNGPILIGG